MNLKSTGFEEGQHLVQFWWVALVGEDLMVEGHQTDSQRVTEACIGFFQTDMWPA